MLALKRSSLAASEEQDNVLSCSSCVPHPKAKSATLPTYVARARTPTARPIGRAGKAEWGKSRPLLVAAARQNVRVAAKARDHYHARPRGEQTCFSFTLSSVEISLRIFVFSLFPPLPVVRAPLKYILACDISRQRGQWPAGDSLSRDPPHVTLTRDTLGGWLAASTPRMCYILTSDVNQLVQPPARRPRGHWTRRSRVRNSLFLEESRKSTCSVQCSGAEGTVSLRLSAILSRWFPRCESDFSFFPLSSSSEERTVASDVREKVLGFEKLEISRKVYCVRARATCDAEWWTLRTCARELVSVTCISDAFTARDQVETPNGGVFGECTGER